jgi:hypothetical protein
MIIRDLFFESGSTEATKIKQILQRYVIPALLTLLGGKTYTLLRNLTAPNKPKEKDYTTLVNLLRDHLTPKPIVKSGHYVIHKQIYHVECHLNLIQIHRILLIF